METVSSNCFNIRSNPNKQKGYQSVSALVISKSNNNNKSCCRRREQRVHKLLIGPAKKGIPLAKYKQSSYKNQVSRRANDNKKFEMMLSTNNNKQVTSLMKLPVRKIKSHNWASWTPCFVSLPWLLLLTSTLIMVADSQVWATSYFGLHDQRVPESELSQIILGQQHQNSEQQGTTPSRYPYATHSIQQQQQEFNDKAIADAIITKLMVDNLKMGCDGENMSSAACSSSNNYFNQLLQQQQLANNENRDSIDDDLDLRLLLEQIRASASGPNGSPNFGNELVLPGPILATTNEGQLVSIKRANPRHSKSIMGHQRASLIDGQHNTRDSASNLGGSTSSSFGGLKRIQSDGSSSSYIKRPSNNRQYEFGLGKRVSSPSFSRYDFGLGKRASQASNYRYDFGLGK